jgi:hypothetical protein
MEDLKFHPGKHTCIQHSAPLADIGGKLRCISELKLTYYATTDVYIP